MQRLILLTFMTLGLVSCSGTIPNSDLVGTWKWTDTNGGIGGQIDDTSESTGKTVILKLAAAGTYSATENGSEVSKGTYKLVMKDSIYSGQPERFLKIMGDQSVRSVGLSGIVKVTNGNVLEISDNNYDGTTSRFEKQ